MPHFLRSPPREERSALLKVGSSSDTQLTPLLRAKTILAKREKLVMGVRNLAKAMRTPRAANADVCCGFNDNSDPNMLSAVEQNVVEVRTHAVDSDFVKRSQTPPQYQRTVYLERYNLLTPLLHATLHQYVFSANVFVPK